MNSMVHFFLFSLYHQHTLSSRVSPENSGRRGIPRFSALHSHSCSPLLLHTVFLSLRFSALHFHSVSHSVLLPLPTLQRFLAQYSCSILNHEGYPLNFNI